MQGVLSQASRQWSSRPDDERYTSLHDMHSHFLSRRENSKATVVSSRDLVCVPTGDTVDAGMMIQRRNNGGNSYAPTHYAFGQLCSLVETPAGYMRTIPAALAADCVNYGLKRRDANDVGVLLSRDEPGAEPMFAAVTGANYGRIWNSDITSQLVRRFGNGTTDSDWRVPGEFGKPVAVTKSNTTLYASDRDMFVFLADESNRIEVPQTRGNDATRHNDGMPDTLARGFFTWNSEVGDRTFGFGSFFFRYVCMNRNVWGARDYREINIRHTSRAPDRFLDEVQPVLRLLHEASPQPIIDTVKAAQAARVDDLNEFLKTRRFASNMAGKLSAAHQADEGRPIETLWDVSNAITGYARSIPFQNDRVQLEREAGKILDLVAA